jgi:hypothetical protein
MTVELPDEMYKAMRYSVIALVRERAVAGRGVPPTVSDAYRKLTASGQDAFKFNCTPPQLEEDDDLIGTAATASLLGCSERTVRRRAATLGGIRPTGRDLVFSRRSVVAYTHKASERNPPDELAQ